ncbi:DNA topoisomerase 1 beta [Actinidia rufa]|uniref:DNA topoisomerase n=1 Tax=Actinidia rufa TaxID=165716 RepID=A0A7J0G2H2_9ERIC|nr:DNA topoisomerase 1 beta [Actinidia rufa]
MGFPYLSLRFLPSKHSLIHIGARIIVKNVGNFRVKPPGLFRGRGEHPKMGKLKKRIRPSDITINIGKDAPIPECPIPGQRWKEIRHDNTVTWLAFWNDPINPKEFKYVFLEARSSLKGQSDKEIYEKARLLKDYIQGIRAAYTKDFASNDVTKRQIVVATYLIDKLALRAGNEKVWECGGDDLFDELDTSKLNARLKELMPGVTAKVFHAYNASINLDEMGILDGLKTDLALEKKGKPPLKGADGKPRKNLNPEA